MLRAASGAYRAATALRNAAYHRGWVRPVRLPCPVVSVGSLTVGGAGKTTCVELIARKLALRGRRVAILSRGYGGVQHPYVLRAEAGRLRVEGTAAADLDGLADEPQLLAGRLEGVPIIVGARREETGRLACATFGADTLLLDDGFQHRRLARDCELVLIPARMPLAGWALLPRGPMREPLTALGRADVIVITKAAEALDMLGALQERLRSFNPRAVVVTAIHQPARLTEGRTGTALSLRRLEGAQVGLVSSIGDPQGFEATAQQLHAVVRWHCAFPDHYRYDHAAFEAISAKVAAERPAAVLTTEKDWIRLRALATARPEFPVPVWVVGVQMELLSGEALLDDRLARVCAR